MKEKKSISPSLVFFGILVLIALYGDWQYTLNSIFIQNETVRVISYIYFLLLIVLSIIKVYNNFSWGDIIGDGKVFARSPELYLPDNRIIFAISSLKNSVIHYIRIKNTGPIAKKIAITKFLIYFLITAGIIGRLINWNEQLFK